MKLTRCAVAFALSAIAGSPHGLAASVTCYTIRAGDTAAQVAVRLAGSAGQRHGSWFQIVDARSRLVAKVDYDRILPGWRACIIEESARTRPSQPSDKRVAWRRASLGPADLLRTFAAADLALAVWRLVAGVLVVLLACVATHLVGRYLGDRQAVVSIMERFGERFIREFERPLLQPGVSRAIKTRLQCMPHRRRLNILLAPSEGRTYPNLADHRKNVEYDVGRVLHIMTDEPFVVGPLSLQGQWVIVPCRFRVAPAERSQ